MSDDDRINQQFPYSVKSQATADGFRVTAHIYGDNLEQVITDCANATLKELNELEFRGLVIAANQRQAAVEKPKEKSKK